VLWVVLWVGCVVVVVVGWLWLVGLWVVVGCVVGCVVVVVGWVVVVGCGLVVGCGCVG